MIQKQNSVIQNFNSTPIRRVFPKSQQSPIYETPQYRISFDCGWIIGYVSLFGNGEDLCEFTKSKIQQFEAQLKKIENVNEEVYL